ncbi:hypothetical protein [Rhizobium tropici]|uniref:Uncharacterized protein n=1 Tax=Rhizobium tropici TaxID=398 RepID=A0A329YES0_RHITR|nr:hypothetical protein [Rhizobium tropici]RAX42431.1 hypothetical protein DQ393_06220 [Rhizobium tropici]
MMHRTHSSHPHLNHFTPFLPSGSMAALRDRDLLHMSVDRQRRFELALLAVIAVSLGAAIAWML